MNKLLIVALLGCMVFVLTAAENSEEQSLQAESGAQLIQREVREADPAKKKKNKNAKKSKKNRRGKKKSRKSRKLKKGKKSKSKKSRRGKKGKRKSRRTKKAKKGRKNRNNRKNKNRKSKKAKKGLARQTCAVPDSCLDNAVSYFKLLKDKVNNYQNQLKRVNRQLTLGTKKNSKKGNFAPLAAKIIQQGGGNASALSCAGSTSSEGAKKLKGILSTLDECQTNIQKVCNTSAMVSLNKTETSACESTMKSFSTKVLSCFGKTGAEACTCVNDASLKTMAETIKKCDLSKTATSQAKLIKKCTSAFGACKTKVDEAGTALHACNSNPKALASKLKQLTKNKDNVAKALAKMKSLATRGRSRQERKLSSCSEVITSGTALITILEEDSSSPQITVISLQITVVSVTCSASEKAKLKSAADSLETAAEAIDDAITAVQETLEALTGSTASAAVIEAADDCGDTCSNTEATTSASVGTTKSSRRRRIAIEDLLKQQIMSY